MRLIGRRCKVDAGRQDGPPACERAGAGQSAALQCRLAGATVGGAKDGLNAWRRVAGLTQIELARKARISRATISHLESGRCEPSCGIAGKICRALSEALAAPLYTWDIFPAWFTRPAALPAAQQTATEEVASDVQRS